MMSHRTFSLGLWGGLVLLAVEPRLGMAQLAVQQPAFGVNSVATTVSVPDRGRAHLGSISRARDSRTQFGPFQAGTSMGLDREHSGMSVGVYIHDFEAMDQYLLSQGSNVSTSDGSQLSGNARHAWNQLQGRHGNAPASPLPDPQTASKADKYWQLGQKAEREGNLSVARLHYRIASRHGSRAADTRMAEWDAPNSGTPVATSTR